MARARDVASSVGAQEGEDCGRALRLRRRRGNRAREHGVDRAVLGQNAQHTDTRAADELTQLLKAEIDVAIGEKARDREKNRALLS